MADKTLSKEELIEADQGMTVLDLAELVKPSKTSSASVPRPPDGHGRHAGCCRGRSRPEEEKTQFDVVLTSFGDKKIQVIKVVRALTGLGLKEAKAVVEGVPSTSRKASPRTRPKRPRSSSKPPAPPSRSSSQAQPLHAPEQAPRGAGRGRTATPRPRVIAPHSVTGHA